MYESYSQGKRRERHIKEKEERKKKEETITLRANAREGVGGEDGSCPRVGTANRCCNREVSTAETRVAGRRNSDTYLLKRQNMLTTSWRQRRLYYDTVKMGMEGCIEMVWLGLICATRLVLLGLMCGTKPSVVEW